MKTEDKLLDFLNGKLSDYESGLPENDWHDFEEKLDSSTKKRNRIIFVSLSSILVLALALFLFSNSRQIETAKEETGLAIIHQSYSHADITDHDFQASKSMSPDENTPNAGSDKTANTKVLPEELGSVDHPEAQSNESLPTADKTHKAAESRDVLQSPDVVNARITDENQELAKIQEPVDSQETAYSYSKSREEETLAETHPIPLQSEEVYLWSSAPSLNVDKQYDTVHAEEEKQELTEPDVEKNAEKNSRSISVMGRQKFVLELNLSSAWSDLKEDVSASNAPKIHEDYEIIHGKALEGSMAYALGMNISYFFTPAFSVKSGFFYDEYKSGGLYNYVNDKTPVTDAEGNIIAYIPKGPDFIEYVYEDSRTSFSYIQMPLILGLHQMVSPKVRLDMHGGLSLMYLINAKGKSLSYNDLSLKELKDFHPDRFNYGLILGLGTSFLWSENIVLSLEPTYKQSLSSVYETKNPVEVRPYAFGLKLGINWIIE